MYKKLNSEWFTMDTINSDILATREAIRPWFKLLTASRIIIIESPHSYLASLFYLYQKGDV